MHVWHIGQQVWGLDLRLTTSSRKNFLLRKQCCVLRQDTYLSQCLSLGNGEFNVGDKPAMDKHPIQGEETGISYGIDGLLGLYAAFNLPLVKSSGCNIFISNQQIFNHGCDM